MDELVGHLENVFVSHRESTRGCLDQQQQQQQQQYEPQQQQPQPQQQQQYEPCSMVVSNSSRVTSRTAAMDNIRIFPRNSTTHKANSEEVNSSSLAWISFRNSS